MRGCLIGIAVLVVIGLLVAWPYRGERVFEAIANNRTGCKIFASNSSGWKVGRSDLGIPGERFEDPLLANIAIFDCPGTVDGTPASTIVIAPDGHRQEACDRPRQPGETGCAMRLRTPPPEGGAPQRYRLLIQLRAGEPAHAVDMDVSREDSWHSGSFDALMGI